MKIFKMATLTMILLLLSTGCKTSKKQEMKTPSPIPPKVVDANGNALVQKVKGKDVVFMSLDTWKCIASYIAETQDYYGMSFEDTEIKNAIVDKSELLKLLE